MKRLLFRLLLMVLLAGLRPASAPAQRLSALAPPPDWQRLEAFQETMTREQFTRLLEEVYAPNGAARGLIDLVPEGALIRTSLEPARTMTLRFAREPAAARPAPRFWKKAAEQPPAARPLEGVRIALDPGHLGGDWARMEERWFKIGETIPVTEGDLTLRVAQLLAPKLRNLGAEILWVRHSPGPTTPERPQTLVEAARAELALQGITPTADTYENAEDPGRGTTLQFQSELLFYRVSEIRHRAGLLAKLEPDLTLCLHFNAEAWGDPLKPDFVPRNHLHILVNGCYSPGELRNDDVRLEMLLKLLGGSYAEELAASENVAAVTARQTALAPYEYPGENARRTGQSAYVWARNLLANRLYPTPVVFLEPYVMNNQEVWERVQAGDYEGERLVAGAMRKSLVREYADAVAEGLASYYLAARPAAPTAADAQPAVPK